jgi:hypothetical protein
MVMARLAGRPGTALISIQPVFDWAEAPTRPSAAIPQICDLALDVLERWASGLDQTACG